MVFVVFPLQREETGRPRPHPPGAAAQRGGGAGGAAVDPNGSAGTRTGQEILLDLWVSERSQSGDGTVPFNPVRTGTQNHPSY